jgi:hypothetical protein
LCADTVARRALLDWDALPTAPGALATVEPAVAENDVYDVEKLRLIFYDTPIWRNYQRRFARIFRAPRYFSLSANLAYFAAVYANARQNLPGASGDGEATRFLTRYQHYLDREIGRVTEQLAEISRSVETSVEALA